MEPTLLPGDLILISKMSYGARLLRPYKYFKQKKIDFIRIEGLHSIQREDIFVFNWPNYNASIDSTETYYGNSVVKRCIGLPGDNVYINKKDKKNRKDNVFRSKYNLFPKDSTLGWTIDNYGPLYVPARGKSIELTKTNLHWYKDIFLYENPKSTITDTALLIGNKPITQYTFKFNYFFMLGDNFYHSEDSRYWGFVPYDNIKGKASIIIFSFNRDNSGFKKIRWNRIFKVL
jgi:signal peptidase I